jgi:hypothetical protein
MKKNTALPYGVNAANKVVAFIRWAHENQVMAVCFPESLAGKRMRDYLLKA